MRAGAYATLVRKLINSQRTTFESDSDIFQELCGELGVIQIELEHFYEDGVHKDVLYSKYDTTMLNEADYSENLNFEYSQIPIHLSFWFDYEITDVDEERGDCVNLLAGILKLNISRYMRLNEEKSAQTHDLASGVLNSRGFIDEGQEILDKGLGDRYTCLYINVAKFKVINQLYGHDAGDIILTQVARDISIILSNYALEYLVGRLSGDSYVCLVNNNLVDKFLKQLGSFSVRFRGDDGDVDLALSFYIGVYKVTREDEDMSVVLENSSTAYSMARQNGNLMPVYYDLALRDRLLREKDIESRMRTALEKREFVVYYQPKIDLTDYSLMGAEALVRWMEGDKVIPPDEFVPLFERNGFICN
ncbi:MAG: diguanylate cyclase, partial [Lachnospiraceae bacterium]|nr:diguanylate cyclase [Lachnospiraceae bacterium]